MSVPISIRPAIRHFSVRRPPADTRTSKFVASSCLVSAVLLPFVPPALESFREKDKSCPNKWAFPCILNSSSPDQYTDVVADRIHLFAFMLVEVHKLSWLGSFH
jgi:hypothetical protein